MYKKFSNFICLMAIATTLPVAANAALLDPFVARAAVSFGPIDPVREKTGELRDAARIDPLTGNRGESGVASASASIQGLKASAVSQVMGGASDEPARVFSAAASAKVQSFFDLVFSDTTGSGKTHTDVSMSFFLDGVLSISGINLDGRSWVSPALTLDYGLGQAGLGFPSPFKELGKLSFTDAFQSSIDNPIANATGIFEGLEYRSSDLISQEFTTPTVNVPLDTILSFKFELRVGAGGTSNGGDQLGAQADFGNTLTFSPNAFFNLAPGITANSAELGIENNRFSTNALTPVPLPASFWLLPVAIGAMRILRFRRQPAKA